MIEVVCLKQFYARKLAHTKFIQVNKIWNIHWPFTPSFQKLWLFLIGRLLLQSYITQPCRRARNPAGWKHVLSGWCMNVPAPYIAGHILRLRRPWNEHYTRTSPGRPVGELVWRTSRSLTSRHNVKTIAPKRTQWRIIVASCTCDPCIGSTV